MTLGSRIEQRLQALNMRQSDLVREVNKRILWIGIGQLTKGALHNIIRRNSTGSKYLTYIASVLDVDPAWLVTGKCPEDISAPPALGDSFVAREPSETTIRMVPLIDIEKASNIEEIRESLLEKSDDGWIPVGPQVGVNGFALEVQGSSMLNPFGDPSFPQGTILIVDADVVVDAGRFVIAMDAETSRATFKQLVHDAGKWFLQPLNPAFPTVPVDRESIHILGVVVEARMSV